MEYRPCYTISRAHAGLAKTALVLDKSSYKDRDDGQWGYVFCKQVP